MMKYIILAVVFVVAYGRPQEQQPPAAAAPSAEHGGNKPNVTIVSQTNKDDGKGTYQFSYKLSDGTSVEEEGFTIPPSDGSTDATIVKKGSYSYTDSDGMVKKLTYISDINGFQPKADYLPTPPADPNSPKAAAGAPAGRSLDNPAAAAAASASAGPTDASSSAAPPAAVSSSPAPPAAAASDAAAPSSETPVAAVTTPAA